MHLRCRLSSRNLVSKLRSQGGRADMTRGSAFQDPCERRLLFFSELPRKLGMYYYSSSEDPFTKSPSSVMAGKLLVPSKSPRDRKYSPLQPLAGERKPKNFQVAGMPLVTGPWSLVTGHVTYQHVDISTRLHTYLLRPLMLKPAKCTRTLQAPWSKKHASVTNSHPV